ncbi:hypothetical protein GH714_034387 [Hevea brasiliensis]|uniref:Uncharacterized protein n=1 Tax=Hevea brasiliensis TaxID=3981 RepID=A0A6A6NEA7_HEVBR|nr:hypothetical protein GH714_034387 [Hevea brasiliensis]
MGPFSDNFGDLDIGDPISLRKLSEESGSFGLFKPSFLKTDLADSGDNPHELMRNEIVKESPFDFKEEKQTSYGTDKETHQVSK